MNYYMLIYVLVYFIYPEGVTKIGVEKFEAMEEDEDDQRTSATGPQRCKQTFIAIGLLSRPEHFVLLFI